MNGFSIDRRPVWQPPLKTIYLVRHGQSIYNARALESDAGLDERYVDAPLTPLGESQASSLSAKLKYLDVDLVVCSPMTLATQFCLLACAGSKLPDPVVNPLCRGRLTFSCDIESPLTVLRRRFPYVDYGLVRQGEAWWYVPETSGKRSQHRSLALLRSNPDGNSEPRSVFNKRVNEFREWLASRPEKRILVIAHKVVINTLTNLTIANGEVKEWKL